MLSWIFLYFIFIENFDDFPENLPLSVFRIAENGKCHKTRAVKVVSGKYSKNLMHVNRWSVNMYKFGESAKTIKVMTSGKRKLSYFITFTIYFRDSPWIRAVRAMKSIINFSMATQPMCIRVFIYFPRELWSYFLKRFQEVLPIRVNPIHI